MLMYILDHNSAHCSPLLRVGGTVPKNTCSSQQDQQKRLSGATNQANTSRLLRIPNEGVLWTLLWCFVSRTGGRW